jgi:hypothetical protein
MLLYHKAYCAESCIMGMHALPCCAVLPLPQALLQAEWDATNAAEVMKAVAEPPGEHTIAGDLQDLQVSSDVQRLKMYKLQDSVVLFPTGGAHEQCSKLQTM